MKLPLESPLSALDLDSSTRSTHLHIVGSTGSGKSKLLEHLIRQDILANRSSRCGIMLIDPHGSLYDDLLAWCAFHNLDRPIVPIDLRRSDWIVAYNLLRHRPDTDPSVVVDAIVDAIAHVWGASNTDATPRLARWVGNILRVLYEKGYTLIDALHLIGDEIEVRRRMTANIADSMTRRDWKLAESLKPKEFEEEIGSSVNRLRRFITSTRLRLMFGQRNASLDLRSALDNGSIILVSLARQGGNVSKENADLFATLLLSDLWIAAQERGKSDRNRPFYVYIDEFQRFLTPTIAENLDEARGFGLHLTLAHQFPTQLRNAGEIGRRVFDSVMENARSKIVFSLSTKDNLEPMAQWLFTGVLDPDRIKHELYSTKVMEYREETRTSTTGGTTRSKGGTEHSSHSTGEGEGQSHFFSAALDPEGDTASASHFAAGSEGSTDSWSESSTHSETTTPVLLPIMGKELSSVQFESLDEQMFRVMATLFDQEQRHCVVRLRGMRAPIAATVPEVVRYYIKPERVDAYVAKALEKSGCALREAEARESLELQKRSIEALAHVESTTAEPATTKRRIRKAP